MSVLSTTKLISVLASAVLCSLPATSARPQEEKRAKAIISPTEAFFEIGHDSLFRGRFDPVVNPGQISGHAHTVVGGNAFSANVTYEDLLGSACTTQSNQADLSAWWTASLYYKDKSTGMLSMMSGPDGLTGSKTYWLNRLGDNNTLGLVDYPPGFRMVAGDPYKDTAPVGKAEQMISYTCSGASTGSPSKWYTFPTNDACSGHFRSQVFFPSCWDGVNVDSPDHKSHVAYPDGGDTGNCPPSHPYRLPSTFMETFFALADDQPFYDGCFVSAQGDNTGYGLHGDFIYAFINTPDFTPGSPTQTSLLVRALTECTSMSGSNVHCDLLKPYDNPDMHCGYPGITPAEDIGLSGPISKLAGDNAIWTTSASKVAVAGDVPGVIPAQPPIPADWEKVGCAADPSGSKSVKGTQAPDDDNLVPEACIASCAAKGYPVVGIEFGKQCACDDAVNSASKIYTDNTDIYQHCGSVCTGLVGSGAFSRGYCGGGDTMTIYKFTGSGSPTAGNATYTPVPLSEAVAPSPSYSADPVLPAATDLVSDGTDTAVTPGSQTEVDASASETGTDKALPTGPALTTSVGAKSSSEAATSSSHTKHKTASGASPSITADTGNLAVVDGTTSTPTEAASATAAPESTGTTGGGCDMSKRASVKRVCTGRYCKFLSA